ncbi:MAG: bifunctional (p)ppGpp synthetase/guanosine-3',5'-bis(diphosphate) 3'-pyrophosphohydrolase [Proteobacteria bacterium]|nr:bifunctional (p)ppGpp synthetase/guanosine-3',5'-bis(diphosphate) 3'-pyrophosphohydrolase [Pseudomonadota bacterium]
MTTSNEQKLYLLIEQYQHSAGVDADYCLDVGKQLVADCNGQPEVLAAAVELLEVLIPLSPDPDTLGSAMAIVPQVMLGRAVNQDLPAGVLTQVTELQKLFQLEAEHLGSSAAPDKHRAEGLRRLLLALVEDVRVVLVTLSWRLVQLRHAVNKSAAVRKTLGEETLLIHAPLANRLGVWQLKWELEDFSFRYTQPDEYRRISHLVAERRADREEFISGFLSRLGDVLSDAGISADVRGRPKHIYSIWRKMQQKGLDFHELFDVRAVRVLVDDIPTCYSALGLVHTHWQPIPGEFDDYITLPKGNMYQSLHTAVVDDKGRAVEVQIRTWKMHEHAELGVAAHWRYKEGGPQDPGFDRKIAAMRQLMEGVDVANDDASLLDSFKSVTSEERIYALTPNGDVVDLVAGGTVLDFAYHVHTEVGHRCRGAKINGRIVPLTTVVKTGERVEILTGSEARPSRDWLNPRLGYIRGGRARAKVRQWYKKVNYEINLQDGHDLLEGALSRLSWSSRDLEPMVERFSLGKLEDLYVAIGAGDLTVAQVINALERDNRTEDIPLGLPKRNRSREALKHSPDEIVIEGVGNLMINIAKCCHPVPGDPIMGFITRGRGISIHRQDCPHILNLRKTEPQRVIQVNWGEAVSEYEVDLNLTAFDRRELLKDISTVLASENVNVMDMSSRVDQKTDEFYLKLTVRIKDYEQLNGLLNRLNMIPNVMDVRRTG